MSDQCVGEIRMFAGNYAPEGWALCDGTLLPLSGNEALYSLIGVIYGGNGTSDFGLPDLRGRLPIGMGQSQVSKTVYAPGQSGGTETVLVTADQLPTHTHNLMASSAPGSSGSPENNYLATSANSGGTGAQDAHYLTPSVTVAGTYTLNQQTIGEAGGNAAHANIMPSYCVNFIIALQGVYPQFQ